MMSNRSIQFKAGFLLAVFGLNTLVGFACSMGVDMGFNTKHHGGQEKGEVHIHKDGKKHIHTPASDKHHPTDKTKGSTKDDCCKDKVIKLQTADKSFQYSKVAVNAPEFTIAKNFKHISVFNRVDPCLQEYIACHFHPPPRDIRIEIQSFQI